MEYSQTCVIGGRGSGPDRFTSALSGISIDRQDRLYAAGDTEVKIFSPSGALVRRWSVAKPPLAITAAPDGLVWVGQAGQIQVFDGSGMLTRTWSDAASLGEVTAIGFSGDCVFIADSKDRCLRRFDGNLNLRNNIGKDNRMKGFLIPNGVLDFAIDAGGIIHAANPGKHRVERYTADDQLLGHIGRFDGVDPSGFAGCCNPTNLTLGPQGWVYVTEKAAPRAKVLDAGGRLLAVIASSVFDPGCKNMDIALDSRGRVFVTDTVRLEIIVFEPARKQEAAP